MDLATKTAQMFPHGHLEKVSPTKVRLEFTEAESAEISLVGQRIIIRCTCPALRDDLWMDTFNKRGTRADTGGTWNVIMNSEEYQR